MAPSRKTVLVVNVDETSRERLATLVRRDRRVLRAGSAESALGIMEREGADLVLSSTDLPGLDTFDFLRIVRENYPLTEFIVTSGAPDVDAAVAAVKLGAYHFLLETAADDTVESVVFHALERQDLNRQVMALSTQVEDQSGERRFVSGPSPATREVLETISKVSMLSATVLVLGESGTGKELVARMLHRKGEQPDGPFIPVNVAAVPRELVESTLFGHEKGAFTGAVRQQLGKFELAHGGTLFLDEIGDLKLDLQAKLLRAIQEGEIERVGGSKPIRVRFRLIAATNVDLERAVKDGAFREDLYYRLNVIPIRIPPLRERAEDIPDLVKAFLARYNARFRKRIEGVATSTMTLLQQHDWPGNIRELENLVERLVATCDHDWITDGDLPFDLQTAALERGAGPHLLDRAMTAFERSYILRALERNQWNVTQTSRHLGIPLSTLKFKLDKLEIRDIARRVRGG